MTGSRPDTGAGPELRLDLVDWDFGEGPCHIPQATLDYWDVIEGATCGGRLLIPQLERDSPTLTS